MHPITESVLVLAATRYSAQFPRTSPTGWADVLEMMASLVVVIVVGLYGFIVFIRWAHPAVTALF